MLDRSSEFDPMSDRDALSEVLQDFGLVGVSYGHCRMQQPWGVSMPTEETGRLHVVVAGACWLRMEGAEPVRLVAGDVVFLPRGVTHSLSDAPRRRTRPLSDFPPEEIGDRTYRIAAGGDGSRTLLACCAMRFDQPALHPLLEMMPAAIVLRRAALEDPTLPALLDAMADEVMANRLGIATVLARLADLVVIRLVRVWVEGQAGEPTGWLAAMRDPNVGRALVAMHRRPGEPWSVESLAALAGLSRSLFFERFTGLTGMTPARYLARWRMRLARLWLHGDRLSIAQAAARLGYGSEAAFSRAYKRHIGRPPSASRRDRQGALAAAG